MANATEMPSFKMLCTNNNEFTVGGAIKHGGGAANGHHQQAVLMGDWRLSSGLY